MCLIKWHLFILLITINSSLNISAGSLTDESDDSISSQGILDHLLQDLDKAKTTQDTISSSTTKKPKRITKRPKGFQGKEAMIERNTKFQLKHNPTMSEEKAKEKAIKRYEEYAEAQRIKSRIRSQNHKIIKQFVKSVDPSLAKVITRDPPTKKIHFIARKEEEVKRKHVGIKHEDATKIAHQMYDDLAQKRLIRQRRHREAKKEKSGQKQ